MPVDPVVIGRSEAEPDQPLINKQIQPDIIRKLHFQAYLLCSIIFSYVTIFTMKEYHRSTSKSTSKNRKLLDEVWDVMRLHHYLIHTERTYCDWIKRYTWYHSMTGRQDLIDGEAKIEAFLTHLTENHRGQTPTKATK